MRIDGALGLLATSDSAWHSRWLGPSGLIVSVLLHGIALILLMPKHQTHDPERNGFISAIPVEIVTPGKDLSQPTAATPPPQLQSPEPPRDAVANENSPQSGMSMVSPAALDVSHDVPMASEPGASREAPMAKPVALGKNGDTGGQRLSAKEASMAPPGPVTLRQQIARCWQPIYDGGGSPVSISLVLNIAGAIEEPPKISVPEGAAYGEATLDAIRRAIYTCAPYDFPASTFTQWHHITLDLIPTQKIAD